MGNRRVLAVIVAVVLVAVAAIATFAYVSGADKRAEKKVHLVTVLVARDDIKKGTTGKEVIDKDLVTTKKINEAALPPGVIKDKAALNGKVAAGPIGKGVPIVDAGFALPGEVSGALDITNGKQAVAMQVDGKQGVAGYIQKDDHVNVIVIAKIKVPSSAQDDPSYPDNLAAFLVQNVKVLAVGQQGPSQGSSQSQSATATPAGATLVTVEVDPVDAERIALAQTNQTLYLTLVPPKFTPAPQPDVPGVYVRPDTLLGPVPGAGFVHRY